MYKGMKNTYSVSQQKLERPSTVGTVSRSTLFVADSSWNRGQSWNIKERSCIWIWVKTLSPFAHIKTNGNYGCSSRKLIRKLWNSIDKHRTRHHQSPLIMVLITIHHQNYSPIFFVTLLKQNLQLITWFHDCDHHESPREISKWLPWYRTIGI